jgi:hypothetical protein
VCTESLDAVELVSFTNRLMLNLLAEHPATTCLHLLGHLSIRLHQRQATVFAVAGGGLLGRCLWPVRLALRTDAAERPH